MPIKPPTSPLSTFSFPSLCPPPIHGFPPWRQVLQPQMADCCWSENWHQVRPYASNDPGRGLLGLLMWMLHYATHRSDCMDDFGWDITPMLYSQADEVCWILRSVVVEIVRKKTPIYDQISRVTHCQWHVMFHCSHQTYSKWVKPFPDCVLRWANRCPTKDLFGWHSFNQSPPVLICNST